MKTDRVGKVRALRLSAAKAYVARCLEETPAGGKLPSIYEMIEASGTTRAAVTQALNHYQTEGVLEVRPKSGSVKLAAARQAANIIDIVFCHVVNFDLEAEKEKGAFHGLLLEEMNNELSRRGLASRIHRVKTEAPLHEYQALARLSDTAGFIILKPALREIVVEFERTGKPVVTGFPQAAWRGGAQVVDSSQMMRRQMEYLLSLGHRRIAHLYPDGGGDEFYSHTHSHRHSDYFRIMAEHGLRVFPHWIVDFDHSEEQMRAALEQMFGADPRPTAVIVADGLLPFVYRTLDGLGLAVGRDVAVLATDGIAMCRRVFPTATSTVNPYWDAAKNICSLLKRRMEGDRTEVVLTQEIGLRAGDSTFSIPRRELSSRASQRRERPLLVEAAAP